METLDTIPFMPNAVFKNSPEVLRPAGGDVVATTSSGTQGTVSVIYRDNLTLQRFFATVQAGVEEVLGLDGGEITSRNVGPTLADSRHLWLAYVMSGVSVFHDTQFYVREDGLHAEELISDLRLDPVESQVAVIGPPPLLLEVALKLATEPLPLSAERKVIAMGGWKRRDNQRISSEEFDAAVTRGFGLRDSTQVRDSFNMVELNTVMFECGHRRKHCPPWLHIAVLEPQSLAAVAEGEMGILAYADPTPTSFPGMILSDDFGHVERGCECPCGITSDVLTIDRRINRVENRGCAMKI